MRGGRFGEDFEDFGLGFGVLVDFSDFVLVFICEGLVIDFAGVAGVIGLESETVPIFVKPTLRGRLDSITAVIVLSETADAGVSSRTGETAAFSILLRVNIPRNPPFDSLLCILGCFSGTRSPSLFLVEVSIGGGRVRRLNGNVV